MAWALIIISIIKCDATLIAIIYMGKKICRKLIELLSLQLQKKLQSIIIHTHKIIVIFINLKFEKKLYIAYRIIIEILLIFTMI